MKILQLRINKYIASCGICSRRKAEEYIKEGKVKVDGQVVYQLSTVIDTDVNKVEIDNKLIKYEEKKLYLMLNKPSGYITTNSEQFGRKSTIDLIHENIRVFPIGRLDKDTEGLLLLTNDGEFANMLTHPRHLIKKTYIVTTDSKITDEKISKLRTGVDIGGYVTKEAEVSIIDKDKLKIIISEGKNRQVRKMCKAVDINVIVLKRIKIGNLSLGELNLGAYRKLNKLEVENLKKCIKNI